MSSGSYQFGNSTTPVEESRSWSGANGKYDSLGKLKLNSYDLTYFRISREPSYHRTDSTPCPSGDFGYFYSAGIHPAYDTSNLELEAMSKLAQAIRGTPLQLGNALATGGQAAAMTASAIANFARSLKNLKRGNVTEAARALGLSLGQRSRKDIRRKLEASDISGAWLALQYGWLPTLSDIHDGWKAYSNLQPRWLGQRIVGKKSSSLYYDGSASPSHYECGGTARFNVRYTAYLSDLSALSNSRRLNLVDPLSIAWEVMPWSFVFDWFIPIGTYLEVLNMAPVLSNTTGCKSVKKTYTAALTRVDNPDYCPGGYTDYRCIIYKRTVGLGSIPLPSFQSLPEAMSPKRIFNALALAHQQIL